VVLRYNYGHPRAAVGSAARIAPRQRVALLATYLGQSLKNVKGFRATSPNGLNDLCYPCARIISEVGGQLGRPTAVQLVVRNAPSTALALPAGGEYLTHHTRLYLPLTADVRIRCAMQLRNEEAVKTDHSRDNDPSPAR
jgi:hypothetical protein